MEDPHPVQIIRIGADGKGLDLDIEALAKICLNDKCRDKPLCVLSIAGDFRKGKSFMLNFFLRYLSHREKHNTDDNWMGDKDQPLEGFSWRGGAQQETTGIVMWSEPFIIKNDKGQEMSVLLMDTQGAFDSEHTIGQSATVFALSTMTSSIQIFNIMHNLQEDNLQVLGIFTEYGRLALKASNEKPFQELVFLIRDWSYPYDYEYGSKGGQGLLDKRLTIEEGKALEFQRVRRHINSCFERISCFLLPHPGLKVATNQRFDGRLADMEPDFVSLLDKFVPSVLGPNVLTEKRIGGCKVTGLSLIEYFKVYAETFKGETIPEPKSILEATAEANNLAAVAAAKNFYMSTMEEVCGGKKPYLNPRILDQKHDQVINEAIDMFKSTHKMGGSEYSQAYQEKLHKELLISYDHFVNQNKSKNMFNIWGTPLVLLCFWFIGFTLSRIFDLVGISPLASLFYWESTIAFITILAYLGLKFTGNAPETVVAIDKVTETLWVQAMEVLVRTVGSYGVNLAT
ncbi:Atlastin-2 [Fragariocoptes setiger]|uniref:Atlastin-2 n=1 Tax=Fragariocoptes setiger TaxID=1670756 RepID=A0ABQ7SA79_9ACAR|nr:Atlastin-2 [Fragariocoptes setiger]